MVKLYAASVICACNCLASGKGQEKDGGRRLFQKRTFSLASFMAIMMVVNTNFENRCIRTPEIYNLYCTSSRPCDTLVGAFKNFSGEQYISVTC